MLLIGDIVDGAMNVKRSLASAIRLMTDEEINEAVARRLGCSCKDPDPKAHHDCDQPCHWADNCPRPDRINRSVAERLGTLTFELIPDPIEGAPLNKVRVDHYPDYCRKIEAAFEIVENLKPTHGFEIHCWKQSWGEEVKALRDICVAVFTPRNGTWNQGETGEADIIPMAICLAFLKVREK